MRMQIPVNTPLLNGNEKKYLNECIDSGWISSEGRFVSEFESKLASRVGRKHGVSVTNGTAAIDLAISVLDIGPGDEVILPTFTIISCILQIIRSGATPVLVDCDPLTFNVCPADLLSKITPRTRAVMIVHIYGLPVDMNDILSVCNSKGILVIEDAAEMHGQVYYGKPCGSFGDISTFSFYPNKHITTGEGGMVLTNDSKIRDKLNYYKNLCFKNNQRFVHDDLGWNLRMTNLQAAVGLAQLERIDEFIAIKRKNGDLYNSLLCCVEDSIKLPLRRTEYAENIYWVYPIVLKNKAINSKKIQAELADMGVGTRPFFFPLHKQPVLKKMGYFENENHRVSEQLYDSGFYIPSGLGLKNDEIEYVSNVLINIIKKYQ